MSVAADEIPPRVFVSHSSHEPEARRALERVVDALESDGFDVLVDYERLEQGAVWRDEIYDWLARCDGAVVLLSAHAVRDSPWVKAEAVGLWLRRAADNEFPLLPVVFPGVSPDAVKQEPEWDPVPLAELQARVLADLDDASTAQMAAGLVEKLQPLKLRVRRTPLEIALTDRLLAVGDETLAWAARELDPELGRFVGSDRHLMLTRRLLATDLARLGAALIRIAGSNPDVARKVFALTVAHAWVDATAAGRILEAMVRAHSVGLNSDSSLTSRLYVRRACTIFPFWDVVPIEAGRSGEIEDMLASAREALVRHLDLRPTIGRAELAEELPRRAIFLVVPCPLLDREIVEAFRSEFPSVTHFFLAGDVDATDVEALGYDDLQYLTPELDRLREQEAIAHCREIEFELNEAARRARDAYDLPLAS